MTSFERAVYFNGRIVPERQAKISIYDSALMFGDMVFEMTRSFNKEQFMLDKHIDRLYASAKYVRIDIPMTKEEMIKQCNEIVKVNDPIFREDDEHRLVIDVTRGLLGIYKDIVGGEQGPNVIIADFPLRWTVASMGPLYEKGINAVVPSQRAIPASLIDPKVKNRSRMHYLLANMDVAQCSGDNNWALLLDTDGFVAEGTGANFFIVKDGYLYTPEGRNILRGIRRELVMNTLAPLIDMGCDEKNLDVYDVVTADEAFFTGTPFCMIPVTSINGIKIGDGKVGPVFEKLADRWSQYVGCDFISQIKGWHKEGTGTSPYQFRK